MHPNEQLTHLCQLSTGCCQRNLFERVVLYPKPADPELHQRSQRAEQANLLSILFFLPRHGSKDFCQYPVPLRAILVYARFECGGDECVRHTFLYHKSYVRSPISKFRVCGGEIEVHGYFAIYGLHCVRIGGKLRKHHFPTKYEYFVKYSCISLLVRENPLGTLR